jgi:predicted permease
LLLQCSQHVRPDGLLKLRGWKVFIRSLINPRLCGISLAVLFEAFEQFSEPATQEPSDPTAREAATQIAKQAAQLSLLVACTGLSTARALKQFRKLVPVLITGQSE